MRWGSAGATTSKRVARGPLLREPQIERQRRKEGGPPGVCERRMRLHNSADGSRADAVCATHRLIDLYLDPPGDELRAMPEQRRLAERVPGTRHAEGAQAELDRHRARHQRTVSQS